MKKILSICFIFLLFLILTGCNNENNNDDNVNINFILGAREESITKPKGETIIFDDIKTVDHDHIIGMFYDINYVNEYKDEKINEDITIYVKVKDGSKYYLDQIDEQEIIDIYYNNYCSHEADKQQIVLRYYFGVYNEGHVVLIINKTKGHPADGRGYQYNILVYKNNMLIDIEDYIENIELEEYISIVSKSLELVGEKE